MIISFLYLLLFFVHQSSSAKFTDRNNSHKLIVNITYGRNGSFILYYNISTKYSYYLTVRLFEHQQIKLGLFTPTDRYVQKSIEIFNQLNSPKSTVYFFIICFYFLRQSNDIDIQCTDQRLSRIDQIPSRESLPTYKPLFIPLMYTLSVLMLLPVIMQHHRRNQVKAIERRKQLRRLSITIVRDNPSILAKIAEIEEIDLDQLPLQMQFLTVPSNDGIPDHAVSTSPNYRSFNKNRENEPDDCDVTADDCIAHLLDSTPWHSSLAESRREAIEMPTFYTNDIDEDPQSLSNYTIKLIEADRTSMETDI